MQFYNGFTGAWRLAGAPGLAAVARVRALGAVVYKPGDATVHGTLVVHGARRT